MTVRRNRPENGCGRTPLTTRVRIRIRIGVSVGIGIGVGISVCVCVGIGIGISVGICVCVSIGVCIGVSVDPGATMLQRTPCAASSRPRQRTNIVAAAFDAA